MSRRELKEFIEKKRVEYKNFTPVFSLALKELVYFNSDGFNHLIFKKNRVARNKEEQILKLSLLVFVPYLIEKAEEIDERRLFVSHQNNIEYVALREFSNKRTQIKIILKRRGNRGRLYFWSVMRVK